MDLAQSQQPVDPFVDPLVTQRRGDPELLCGSGCLAPATASRHDDVAEHEAQHGHDAHHHPAERRADGCHDYAGVSSEAHCDAMPARWYITSPARSHDPYPGSRTGSTGHRADVDTLVGSRRGVGAEVVVAYCTGDSGYSATRRECASATELD